MLYVIIIIVITAGFIIFNYWGFNWLNSHWFIIFNNWGFNWLNSHWFTILNNWPTATVFLKNHHLQLAFIDSWRNTWLSLSFFAAVLSKKDLKSVVALPPFLLFMVQTYILQYKQLSFKN